jgi:hypothetical protein
MLLGTTKAFKNTLLISQTTNASIPPMAEQWRPSLREFITQCVDGMLVLSVTSCKYKLIYFCGQLALFVFANL